MKSRQGEAKILAEDLLSDIELSRIPAEQLLLKATRLARLIEDDAALRWLELELHGYQFTAATRKHLKATGRLTTAAKSEDERAYLHSLGRVEAQIHANETKLKSLSTPSLSGDWVNVAMKDYHANVNAATSAISTFSGIRSAVIGELHSFATRAFHELTFSEEQASLFETVRQEIDGMLAPLSGRTLEKIESIQERLNVGETEAISQAMSTCRRLIDAFADAVYPARADPVDLNGQKLEVKKSNVLNRIDLFVRENTDSSSRQQRLRQAMRGIYERVSTGVHSDVTASEARYLFLETYALLGEVLTLASESRTNPEKSTPVVGVLGDSDS